MKIQAFKWNIEVTEYYVRVNGETVATGYIPTSRSNDIPTDCDGTHLEYWDKLICVKEFTNSDRIKWSIGQEWKYYKASGLTSFSEFTPSELKNFRKVN